MILRQWWSGDRGSLVVEQPQRRPVVTYQSEAEPLKNGSNEDKGVGVKGNGSE